MWISWAALELRPGALPKLAADARLPAARPRGSAAASGRMFGSAAASGRMFGSAAASGRMFGSANLAEPSPTASMVKAWLVADYLRLHGMDERLSPIIRDSANEPAWQIYADLGRDACIERMISMCDLADSSPGEDLSMTLMSARDAVRLGAAIADGRAAGPAWTPWLLDEMRAVRGTGDFGIRHAFSPPRRDRIAIKNGWEKRHEIQEWNVNCLAIADSWVMAALLRYPSSEPLESGAQICVELASGLG